MLNQTRMSRRALLRMLAAGGAAVGGGALLRATPAYAGAAQLSTGIASLASVPADAAEDGRNELLHNWNAYKRLAWGHDELHPVSGTFGEFFDKNHPVGLTIVEALDTLYLMGLADQLAEGVAWIRDNLDFRGVNKPVQIFETNIRMVGGLLSGYLATGEQVLLDQARDIADVLLPAFTKSPTGRRDRFRSASTPPRPPPRRSTRISSICGTAGICSATRTSRPGTTCSPQRSSSTRRCGWGPRERRGSPCGGRG